MAKRAISLIYPSTIMREPLMFNVAVKYHLALNIFWARTGKDSGTATIELEGNDADIDAAIKAFQEKGVAVEPVTGRILFEG